MPSDPASGAEGLDLFAAVGARPAKELLRGAPEIKLGPGEPFDVAATSAACCLVTEGRLALVVINGGRERTIGMIERGDVLVRPMDSWAAVAPGVRCHTIEPSVVVLVDRPRLDRWVAEPGLAAALVRLLSDAVADRELAVAIALEPTVERRLLLKLRQLAERWGSVTPAGIRLDLRLTHQELANMVGAVRESVTIAMGRLADAGEIEVRNRALLIHAPDGRDEA